MSTLRIWRAIPGFPGYEVSNDGQVRSYWLLNGKLGTEPRPRRINLNPSGYHGLTLKNAAGRHVTRPLHILVMAAFVGPRPEGLDIRHLNGIKTDCRPENLEYGTRSENALDRERHTPRTRCKRGHEFDYVAPNGDRGCRTCRRAAQVAHAARKRATR